MLFYSDPSRESDPHALPDCELISEQFAPNHTISGGFYYWYCQVGCLPDSEPIGPFETEAEAVADARNID